MDAHSEAAEGMKAGEVPFDFEAVFRAEYVRIAGVIARVVRDPARAEELVVEVFLKLWRTPQAQGEKASGWLYRAAVRKGLDELRHRTRRSHYERLVEHARPRNPEEIRTSAEEQERVRLVLAGIPSREAELLLLHSHGLSYAELGCALDLNAASIGTLLNRAHQIFRKEYTKRYGEQ
jgi:RNA polymerase sigma-70 factor (ECF subfamily)